MDKNVLSMISDSKESDLISLFADKNVLFVTSKNLDYIRNTQEISLLNENAKKCNVIGSKNKNYFIRLTVTYFRMIFSSFRKYDYVFIGFAPQLFFVFFPFIKKERLIIDFFISVYDTFVDDRKKVSKNSLIAKMFHRIDNYVLNRAEYVVCDTKAHRDYFVKEFNTSADKFIVLYLIADTSIYDPSKYPVKKRREGHLDVLYFGSILPLQGIEVILETMKLLKDNQNIKFTIIGPINSRFSIKKEDYPNTRFISWLSQEELAYEISQSDICLAGHFSSTIGKANRTIAGKTYIYKAMKKPVILGDSDANHELFEEDSMNYFVEMGSSEKLIDCILNNPLYK